MTQRNRNSFVPTSGIGLFTNGQRPDQLAFRDLVDSSPNFVDDPLSINTHGNFVFENAIIVNNTSGDEPGSIRFNGTNFEFRESTGWEPLGGSGGGAFQVVGGGSDVAYNDGNVGVNTGSTPTTYRFQVQLGTNSGQNEQVRIGSAVIHNGATSTNVAYFSHQQHANDNDYALRQNVLGDVSLNSATGRRLRFMIGNTEQMALTEQGHFVIGQGQPDPPDIDADTNLFVYGNAFKSTGGGNWRNGCDERLKKDVKSFTDGLNVIKKINPIQFRYNGAAWTKDGEFSIGVSGQEMQKVGPYMLSTAKTKMNVKDKEKTEVLLFDSSPLIYIAINAIKELSKQVDQLKRKIRQ